jgi:2',3'-cyclic-nucleotide 2'-phosphodiesterase (5'-nucleotidase family)
MIRKLSMLLVSCVVVACSVTTPRTDARGITFIHLNDTYRIDAVEDDKRGGFSRVVTLIRELQDRGRDVRILHGGDFLYPSLESQVWDGMQMIDAMNFLDGVAPLYATSGNHEFDPRGPESLITALRGSRFDWVGDNFRFDTGDAQADAALKSGFTFTAAGRTVGIVSLTLHEDDGGNARSYLDIDPDYMAVAERTIRSFEERGVDLIIGVTHVHMWQDIKLAALKERHPKLAFVVGGHEHEPQYEPGSANAAAVMKGASNARVIWQIDVDFDAAGSYTVNEKRIEVDDAIAFDPAYEELVTKWQALLMEKFPFLEARVGTAALRMDAREQQIRTSESSWGNFIVDQMRTAFGEPYADLAFINSGTLRIDDFIEDDILFEDIGRTFGFSSHLRHTTVTGAEFREILEAGYRGEPYAQGYFPQVSGFRICVDNSRPEFDRIVSLQVPVDGSWAEIAEDKQYTLVVPDFLYNGGDGYSIPHDRFASRPASELKYLVLDAILRAQARGHAVGKAITPDNRRIHILADPAERCWSN